MVLLAQQTLLFSVDGESPMVAKARLWAAAAAACSAVSPTTLRGFGRARLTT